MVIEIVENFAFRVEDGPSDGVRTLIVEVPPLVVDPRTGMIGPMPHALPERMIRLHFSAHELDNLARMIDGRPVVQTAKTMPRVILPGTNGG